MARRSVGSGSWRGFGGRCSDYGRIDVLVNDIWGAEIFKGGPADWNTPIWDHDLDAGATHPAARDRDSPGHLPPSPAAPDRRARWLLVEVTDGTTDFNASQYRISVFYDLAKVAANRLAFSQGHELEPHGATALAITPGWLRSEMVLDNFAVTEANWREALEPSRVDGSPTAPEGFSSSESPR